MHEFNDQIHQYIAEAVRKRQQAVEQACEQALQGGLHGVSVHTWNEDTSIFAEARVDPDVPYGHVYEYPYGERP